MLGIGLLGAGFMARTHARALGQVQGARLVAVGGRDPRRAQELAAAYGARAWPSWEDVLSDPEVDAVDICLPTDLHREACLKAAATGRHVFCEKPIAPASEAGREMVAACRQAGVCLMVGHVVRFFPDALLARTLVRQGAIGEARIVRASRGAAYPDWGSDDWFGDPQRSGGILIDLLIHDIDFVRWLFGPVRRVYGHTLTGRRRGLDYALVSLRTAGGVLVHLEGRWCDPPGTPFRTALEIAGTEGLLQLGDGRPPLTVRTRAGTGGRAEAEAPLGTDPYGLELQAFVDAVRDGSPPPVTGEDAVASLEVAEAALRSARTGRVVHLGGEQA